MKGIRKNRNQIDYIMNSGQLRQTLEKYGEMSQKEIQFVIDAVSEKLYAKND